MAKLTWADLLVDDISADDFAQWFSPWDGIITGQIAPAFMSKFGTWFLRPREGPVEMVDVFTSDVEQIAATYDEFVSDINQPWWQKTYLLSDLVLKLHEEHKAPGPGQCYALARHPAVGGPNPMLGHLVESRFVMLMDIPVWQQLCAQFTRSES